MILAPRSQLFLFFALVFGTCFALLLPPMQVPDEWGHFYRVYSVSTGTCRAPEAMAVPMAYRRLELLYPPHVESTRRISGAELREVDRLPFDESEHWVPKPLAVELYSCAPYLPAGMATFLGRRLGASALELLYLGRFANLASYTLIVLLALHLSGDFWLIVFCLALMPETLQQAASLSPDAVTNAASFLTIALLFFLAARAGPMTWRESVVLGLVLTFTALCKFNVWLIAPILLIPGARFQNARARWMWVFSMLFITCCAAAAWQFWNAGNIQQYELVRQTQSVNIPANASQLRTYPVHFLFAVGRTLITDGFTYLRQYVGSLAWLSVALPGWLVLSYAGLLIAVAATRPSHLELTRFERTWLVLAFLGFVLSTFALLWTFEAHSTDLAQLSTGWKALAPGVQGRYFIAPSMLVLMALASPKLRRFGGYMPALALTLVSIGGITALRSVWHAFYTDASKPTFSSGYIAKISDPGPIARKYQGQLVRHPGPAPEDQKVYWIDAGEKHWVLSATWISAHGYRWPDDVKTIPADDLNAIPLGAPAQD